MFDSVTLNQDIHLRSGEIAPQGTEGAIAEIFKDGEAYILPRGYNRQLAVIAVFR